MADTLTLGGIIGGAAIIAGSIYYAKPAEELPQFDDAVTITATDAKIIPEHEQVVDSVTTITVPAQTVRPQISVHIQQPFSVGDKYTVRRYRNDSLIQEDNAVIAAETYPDNGHVLKIIGYDQWVESLPE